MAIRHSRSVTDVPAFAPLSAPLYLMYELAQAALAPARALADTRRFMLRAPVNPWSNSPLCTSMVAAMDLFERTTRRQAKPEWRIVETKVDGEQVPVQVNVVWSRPFCRLLHFERAFARAPSRPQPRLVIVAPLSGQHATLLRGTVEAFLPTHDVYVTDWVDARLVPLSEGAFDLSHYVDYLMSIFHYMGGDCHVMAISQSAVPVLMAIARMEEAGDPLVPRSMVLMSGPIDTRASPTALDRLVQMQGLAFFRTCVITQVPWPHPGAMRQVYPGFLQLSGLMSLYPGSHLYAHRDVFRAFVEAQGECGTPNRAFDEDDLAVMDLPAEFYLDTLDQVFIRHALPRGESTHHGARVRPQAISRVALMTVEGEMDDISSVGQTFAAHALCPAIPADRRAHWVQPQVGHYGVFMGARFRAEIAPRIADFVRAHNQPRVKARTTAGRVARGNVTVLFPDRHEVAAH